MANHYQTLGVKKNATKDDIKKAFRKLAHEHHPDKTNGDEIEFKRINEAYSVLKDDKKRAIYDRGGDNPFGSHVNEEFNAQGFSQTEYDLGDIFGEMFRQTHRPRGRDVLIDIAISFRESVLGVKRDIAIPYASKKKETISINIPPDIRNGQKVVMRGSGESINNGDSGDLYIRISITQDKHFRREGDYIIYDLSIKLTESLLGTRKKIDSIEGKQIYIKIPELTAHNDLLRVRSIGSTNFYVRVIIELPKSLSKNAKNIIENLNKEGL